MGEAAPSDFRKWDTAPGTKTLCVYATLMLATAIKG